MINVFFKGNHGWGVALGKCRQSAPQLTRATLKSNALLLSAKFIPRNACRFVAGSSMRSTKLREESTAASTAAERWPAGTGHTPKISPLRGIQFQKFRDSGYDENMYQVVVIGASAYLLGSSRRTSTWSPTATTRHLAVNILSSVRHSPEMWPRPVRGGMRKRSTSRQMNSVCSIFFTRSG